MGADGTGIRRVALLSSAPLVLPSVSPAQGSEHRDRVAALRRAQRETVARLAPDLPVLVVAPGAPSGVHDHARFDLRGLGSPEVEGAAPLAADLLADVTGAAQLPLLVGERLGVDAAVLVATLAGSHAVAVLEAPRQAAGDALVAMGAALARTLSRRGRAVQLVAAGDLSAGLSEHSPRYAIDGAADVQARTVAAVRSGDTRGVADVASEAATVALRAWPAMCVAVGAAAAVSGGAGPAEVDVLEVRGVGHLVGVLA